MWRRRRRLAVQCGGVPGAAAPGIGKEGSTGQRLAAVEPWTSNVGADVEPSREAYRVPCVRRRSASLAADGLLSVANYTTRASSVLNVDRRRSLRHTSCVRVLWTPRGCRATRSLSGGLWFGYLRFHGVGRHGARHRGRTPPPNGIDPREWRAPLRARAPASLVPDADNSVSVPRPNRDLRS